MRHFITYLLMLSITSVACTGEAKLSTAAEAAVTRYNADMAKAKVDMDAKVLTSRTALMKVLQAEMERLTKAGNLDGALAIRAKMTDLSKNPPDPVKEPLGTAADAAEPSDAKTTAPKPVPIDAPAEVALLAKSGKTSEVQATAGRNSPGVSLGPITKGCRIIIQYQSGTWSAYGKEPPKNPDDPSANSSKNIPTPDICSRDGSSNTLLVNLPVATADKPFVFVMPADANEVVLNMNSDAKPNDNVGSVTYRYVIQQPDR